MRRIVVSEFLPEENLARLRDGHEVIYDPDLYGDRSDLIEAVATAAAILVRNRTRIDLGLVTAAPELRVVGRLGVGLDNIDMEACSRAGVTVIPAIGANAVSVAEYVMGAILLLSRGIFGMTESMVAGEWPRQGHAFGRELKGKNLGLIGYGAIAREVASRALAFGMNIVAYDPLLSEDDSWGAVGQVELDELLLAADVISLHVPLSEGTTNLIGVAELEMMRPGALLINTSRGGIVDEPALANALRDGRIAGAAVDVFAVEPLGPEAAALFVGLENVILTPHVAGNTEESVDRVAGLITEAVLDLLRAEST